MNQKDKDRYNQLAERFGLQPLAPTDFLLPDAFKLLMLVKRGNRISEDVYNQYAVKNRMPKFPNPEYDKINTLDEFYNLVYYYTMGD